MFAIRLLLSTSVGEIAAAKRLQEPYAQILLVAKTGGRLLINIKYCPPQAGRNDFGHRRNKNPEFVVIVKNS